MKKSIIFFLIVVSMGCSTMQKSGQEFSNMELATEMTGYDYLALTFEQQQLLCQGVLSGVALLYKTPTRLFYIPCPVNAYDLARRVRDIYNHYQIPNYLFCQVVKIAIDVIIAEREGEKI